VRLHTAGFSMPEKGDNFEEVLFPELPKDDAVKQIEKYRADAKKHGPPPEKRFRGELARPYLLERRHVNAAILLK